MKISPKQYAQALYDSMQQVSPKDHNLVLDKFVKILAQNGNLGKHAEIEKEYKIIELEEKGIRQAEVMLAREVEINSVLMDQLNKIVGKKMEMKKKIDKGIVGGVVVRVDDTLIDASVKGQLDKLNQNLKS